MKLTYYFLAIILVYACSSSNQVANDAQVADIVVVEELSEIEETEEQSDLSDVIEPINLGAGVLSGPMNGYSALREVGIWIQLTNPGSVSLSYHDKSLGDRAPIWDTETIMTTNEDDNIAHFVLEDLKPGTTYTYEVRVNGKVVSFDYPLDFQTQTLWQYRTDPPPFSFIIGSCMYINDPEYDRPGKPYGNNYEILESIAQEDADMMMWLGDNIYLREVDFDSRSGVFYRNRHTRKTEELQPLLAGMHHYAVWDDHDYGPNDSDASYAGKEWTLEAFKKYWMNPNYNVAGEGGISGKFSWQDCDFFLLDNRWVRTDKRDDGHILGTDQMEWLRLALKKSRAPFKFICIGGQALSNAAVYENHAQYKNERDALLQMIDEENIRGVVFLNGDRHSSEVSRLETDDNIGMYELTCSPLTSGAHGHDDEPNTHRLNGSMIGERNYAVVEVSGPRTNRSCTVTYKNVKGETLYKHDLKTWHWKRKK